MCRVQRPDGRGEKAVFETGCFGGYGSVAPLRGQQLEQDERVRDDLLCSFDSAFVVK